MIDYDRPDRDTDPQMYAAVSQAARSCGTNIRAWQSLGYQSSCETTIGSRELGAVVHSALRATSGSTLPKTSGLSRVSKPDDSGGVGSRVLEREARVEASRQQALSTSQGQRIQQQMETVHEIVFK